MRRFIVTGAPGAGKTTLLLHLESMGYVVVEEAATEIIAREQQKGIPDPWENASFIEMILDLQKQRQIEAASAFSAVQFFDRSPLDTYALCEYLGYPISSALSETIRNVQDAGCYESEVFFLDNLGFCEQTAARRISFEESLRFEQIHERVYKEWGYTCLKVPRQSVSERALTLLAHIEKT